MALGYRACEIFLKKVAASGVRLGSIRLKAQQSLKDKEKLKQKPGPKDPGFWLPLQPRPGRYSFTSISRYGHRKYSSLRSLAAHNFICKQAGGPGSGDPDDNTLPIKELPLSKLISIGKRKEFMDKHKPVETGTEVFLDDIKYVSQKNMVPKKVVRMLQVKNDVLSKPIDVLKDKNGDYHVIDGHHRFLVAYYAKRKKIKANVWDAAPLEKVGYVLSPKAMKPKAPATVTEMGPKKNFEPIQQKPKASISGVLPKLKPYIDNEKYLERYFHYNPFL